MGDAVGVFVCVDDEVVFEALAAFVGAVCGFEGVAEGCFVALGGDLLRRRGRGCLGCKTGRGVQVLRR